MLVQQSGADKSVLKFKIGVEYGRKFCTVYNKR